MEIFLAKPNHCAFGDRLDGLDRYREKQRVKTVLTRMLCERAENSAALHQAKWVDAANRSVIAQQAKESARKDQQIEELREEIYDTAPWKRYRSFGG